MQGSKSNHKVIRNWKKKHIIKQLNGPNPYDFLYSVVLFLPLFTWTLGFLM